MTILRLVARLPDVGDDGDPVAARSTIRADSDLRRHRPSTEGKRKELKLPTLPDGAAPTIATVAERSKVLGRTGPWIPPADFRRHDCARYSACLTYADRCRWPTWTCRECADGFVLDAEATDEARLLRAAYSRREDPLGGIPAWSAGKSGTS